MQVYVIVTSHSHKVLSQGNKPAQCLKGLNVSVSEIAPECVTMNETSKKKFGHVTLHPLLLTVEPVKINDLSNLINFR